MALWLIGIMAEMGLDLAERHNSERLRGFCDRLTDRRMDICFSRIAFATENGTSLNHLHQSDKDNKRF